MNLEIPFDRLDSNIKVEYIPLKLALKDVSDTKTNVKTNGGDSFNNASSQRDENVFEFDTTVTTEKKILDTIMYGLLTIFCVIFLLYSIFYFIILRDSKTNIIRQDNYVII